MYAIVTQGYAYLKGFDKVSQTSNTTSFFVFLFQDITFQLF